MKLIRRSLLVVFSALFLVCTALLAVACTEEEETYYTVTAQYESTQGTVDITDAASDKGYVKDESVTVTVTPKTGYATDEVKVNDAAVSLTENKYTFKVAGNTVVKATFKTDGNDDGEVTYYTVTVECDEDDLGTVTLSDPADTEKGYAEDESVTVTVTAGTGNVCTAVAINGVAQTLAADGKYTFTVTEATTVSVSFDYDGAAYGFPSEYYGTYVYSGDAYDDVPNVVIGESGAYFGKYKIIALTEPDDDYQHWTVKVYGTDDETYSLVFTVIMDTMGGEERYEFSFVVGDFVNGREAYHFVDSRYTPPEEVNVTVTYEGTYEPYMGSASIGGGGGIGPMADVEESVIKGEPATLSVMRGAGYEVEVKIDGTVTSPDADGGDPGPLLGALSYEAPNFDLSYSFTPEADTAITVKFTKIAATQNLVLPEQYRGGTYEFSSKDSSVAYGTSAPTALTATETGTTITIDGTAKNIKVVSAQSDCEFNFGDQVEVFVEGYDYGFLLDINDRNQQLTMQNELKEIAVGEEGEVLGSLAYVFTNSSIAKPRVEITKDDDTEKFTLTGEEGKYSEDLYEYGSTVTITVTLETNEVISYIGGADVVYNSVESNDTTKVYTFTVESETTIIVGIDVLPTDYSKYAGTYKEFGKSGTDQLVLTITDTNITLAKNGVNETIEYSWSHVFDEDKGYYLNSNLQLTWNGVTYTLTNQYNYTTYSSLMFLQGTENLVAFLKDGATATTNPLTAGTYQFMNGWVDYHSFVVGSDSVTWDGHAVTFVAKDVVESMGTYHYFTADGKLYVLHTYNDGSIDSVVEIGGSSYIYEAPSDDSAGF